MKVHIILRNDGGNYSPILVTTSADRARAKYIEIMKESGPLATGLIPLLKEVAKEDDGFEYGYINSFQSIKIDGVWYDSTDDVGDKLAMWFLEDVVE